MAEDVKEASMNKIKSEKWWKERFVTLMVIPERTRKLHKVVLPFFLLKLGVVLFALSAVFLVLIGVDYVHVLGRLAENKKLKGENFKLRQDLQLIRNKVDSMEITMERIRNYAKKLQLLTGQSEKGASAPLLLEEEKDRKPASKKQKRTSKLSLPLDDEIKSNTAFDELSLGDRVERVRKTSLLTETALSQLQVHYLAQSAMIAATPSILPIQGWISSLFGYRRHPYDGSYRLHAGVDLVAEPGTPVRATADGMVMFSGDSSGYGKVVVIDHGYGINTVYAHSSKLFVNVGSKVKRGQKIAEVGSTGKSTGPHVHYEIRKHKIAVNPAAFISQATF